MRSTYATLLYVILACMLLQACNSPVKSLSKSGQAQNVILLIGDGMGMAQVSTAFYYSDEAPNIARFEHVGLQDPIPVGAKITDSAAGATAFSTGVKSYNGAIAVNADTVLVPTIIEILSERGWHSGIISTSSITHATPASFYAHVTYRYFEEEIARQLCYSDVDFFIGGGTNFFVRREDGENMLNTLAQEGFIVDTTQIPGSCSPDQKYGIIMAPEGLPRVKERGSFLADATTRALEYFDQKGGRFFLVIEGSQIDWAGHANNTRYLIEETMDFDETAGIVLDYAKKHKNTLVVMTADHETGGFALSPAVIYGQRDYKNINPTWSTGGHTAALIPVFAYGPGAIYFGGIYQNNAIFNKIMQAIR